jgi:hypothetical protein
MKVIRLKKSFIRYALYNGQKTDMISFGAWKAPSTEKY